MYSTFRKAMMLAMSAVTTFSCQEQELVRQPVQNETLKTEVIDFRGEKAVVPFGFPKELFNQSQEDFDEYYHALKDDAGARKAAVYVPWTYDEINSFLIPYTKKYPNLSWEKEISPGDLNRIYRDFPEIKTPEQVREKAGTIFDFYETLCKHEVLAAVIAYEKVRKIGNKRTNDLSPATLSEPEKQVLLNHPLKAPSYANAASDALSFTTNMYGIPDLQEGKKGNAFQHGTWNALIIRYVLKETPASEDDAVTFAREGTSAHEKNNAGGQEKTEHNAMDLHNNMAARQWMRNETKWGIGLFRSMPSISDILNKMQERANSCAKQNTQEILVWHGSIATPAQIDQTWNKLYNDNISSHEHLVRVFD
jgi:hypothetical protein